MTKTKSYFEEIDSSLNLPALEKQVSEFWKKEEPVKKLKKLREKSPNKVYYDGPITSNGLPHYGHALTWVMKDVVPRYWTMNGYQVLRNMGWDCQGLPVEYEVEKELKFEKKDDIEKFGIAKFNDLCRESVLKYQSEMFRYEDLVGRWYDTDEIYSTMDPKYIESMWWSISELYKKGLLYEGYKIVPYSTRAGTSLSSHEVNDGGYTDIEDPFVTVKFELSNEKNTYILAWTTTPWTIPGNLMLAVGKSTSYVKVNHEGKNYILAESRLEEIFTNKDYQNVSSLKSEDLVGLEYKPPFDFFLDKKAEGCFKIVESSHANTDEGTGIVHLAPYGEEDFNIFMKLGVKMFDYLDDTAHFTNMVSSYEGMFYKKANLKIIDDLQQKEVLFDYGTLVHRMPMCWRTNTPLIYKPIKSWYVAVSKIKEKMVKNNEKLDWHPEHVKNGNSKIWLENARDWALSRNRYWGTPLPIWINDKTGDNVVIGSYAELKKLSGQELTDPHRPYVDEIFWEDKENGGTYRRVKDVIDVWYDSGSMPFARFHYPFENKEKFEANFPADYIAEGPDQVRLWFYVMHILGEALFEKCPYKTIVVNGTMLDEKGKKLSKSKKNYKPMDEVLSLYGGDVLRYFLLTSTITVGQDAPYGDEFLNNSLREFFLPFWNCIRYFTTNSNLVGFDPTVKHKSDRLLDRWVLARFQDTANMVHQNMESYNLMEASKALSSFVVEFSTWYVRRSRDVVRDGDKGSISTYFEVLTQFINLMAPFFPFFSETVFEKLNLRKITGQESVHYGLFPEKRDLTKVENDLLLRMKEIRRVVEKVHSRRKELNIPVRQPLQKLVVFYPYNEKLWDVGKDLLAEEVNVKEIEFKWFEDVEKDKVLKKYFKDGFYLDTKITPELKEEADTRELIRNIQAMRKEIGTKLDDRISVTAPWVPKSVEMLTFLKAKTLCDSLEIGEFKVHAI